jgi:hypothetical protein
VAPPIQGRFSLGSGGSHVYYTVLAL